MASDETMTVITSTQDEEFDDTDDGHDHHQQPHNLSRLSMCTSSMYTNEDEVDDDDDDDEESMNMKMYMSRLSMESFDGDADDEEFSDEKEFKGLLDLSSSDSDKEPAGCYPLQATPSRRRIPKSQQLIKFTGASENEEEKGMLRQKMRRNLRKRRISNKDLGFSGESDQSNNGYGSGSGSGSGGGVVVITRPKGGRRSLCMGLEEVKACRDLGFELEHERMLEMPCRVSLTSGSTLDNTTTSSGGNSPIATWRISSPGDDPRDVKARLKVWAQAVALASTSLYCT